MLLKEYHNCKIEFRHGRFDKWAVVVTPKGRKALFPKDTEYFLFLWNMAKIFGAEKVYKDYISIYEQTTKEQNETVVKKITDIAKSYKGFENPMDIVMSVIYFAMIAEENKAFSILGKRIKRLALHQMLVENLSVDYVANFSRGKKWRELDALCVERGF